MRKFIFMCLLVLGTIGQVSAQGMPVYDNTNFITLGKQILEAAKQTENLIKTVEFMRQQKERIEKVSNVVKQLKAVRELARNNERLFDVVRNDVRHILNSPYIKPEEITRISKSFESIIENSLEDLDFVQQILSSDYLKMTDAERAEVLKERETRSKEMVAEIERKTKRYNDIISFREMQDKINNRATNY
ncbi:conjugal transfer protein [Flagellimonas sp. CMM7]|uniref:conjugal transfer protein n=1 Tax=Flagellimonas sp. CMM7 TaxID=2654676 RepID=UPI0013CF6B3D|nr:conjugal transfer protein [Flagellimonas sp. CMM7]UII80100.1 type IV secretion system protein [Flagellimonas sp. CMM7]